MGQVCSYILRDFDDIPEFLKWVTRDNFVLLSYQNYEIVTQGKDQQVVAVNGETFWFFTQ